MINGDVSSRLVSIFLYVFHYFHRRHAPPVRPHCTTDHHGLEVVSTLPKWYDIDDGDNNFFWHVNHSSRLPCASSNWISSCVSTSQAMFFAINWCCALFFHDDDKDAFAILQLWQRWLRRWYESKSFYHSPRVCQCIFVHMRYFFVSFESLLNFSIFSSFFLVMDNIWIIHHKHLTSQN